MSAEWSRCRSCNAAIIWVEMRASGKRMPLDAAPTADGTITVDDDGKAQVDSAPGRAKHKSHFATCPNASQHRQPRPRR